MYINVYSAEGEQRKFTTFAWSLSLGMSLVTPEREKLASVLFPENVAFSMETGLFFIATLPAITYLVSTEWKLPCADI